MSLLLISWPHRQHSSVYVLITDVQLDSMFKISWRTELNSVAAIMKMSLLQHTQNSQYYWFTSVAILIIFPTIYNAQLFLKFVYPDPDSFLTLSVGFFQFSLQSITHFFLSLQWAILTFSYSFQAVNFTSSQSLCYQSTSLLFPITYPHLNSICNVLSSLIVFELFKSTLIPLLSLQRVNLTNIFTTLYIATQIKHYLYLPSVIYIINQFCILLLTVSTIDLSILYLLLATLLLLFLCISILIFLSAISILSVDLPSNSKLW